jgi:hypothetical protein
MRALDAARLGSEIVFGFVAFVATHSAVVSAPKRRQAENTKPNLNHGPCWARCL